MLLVKAMNIEKLLYSFYFLNCFSEKSQGLKEPLTGYILENIRLLMIKNERIENYF